MEKGQFQVLTQISDFSRFVVGENISKHFTDNEERFKMYLPYLAANPINGFVVDRGLKSLEVHILLESGLVAIFALETGKLITVINPQCYQVTRYFRPLNKPMQPQDYTAMEKAAYRNVVLGWGKTFD